MGFLEWLRGVPEETLSEVGKWVITFLGFLTAALLEIRRRMGVPLRSDPPRTTLEVAGALVSDAQAKAIVAALTANTEAMARNTDAAHRLHDSADDLKGELRDLRQEIRHTKP